MAISNLFSKRQKKLRGDRPDVYKYDYIPNAFRVQIVHLWDDALGNRLEYNDESLTVKNLYRLIVGTLCREYGMFTLASFSQDESRDFRYELQAFFLSEIDHEKLIDTIELSFMTIDQKTRNYNYKYTQKYNKIADAVIKELNERFREHAIGYRFEDGRIFRIDAELIHSEVVKPALRILTSSYFEGAQEEFLKAHGHYREGNHKEALNESLKAFKSTMKAICDKNKWVYNPKATSKQLIKICLDNDLISLFWRTQMHGLSSILESGVSVGRNKSERQDRDTTPPPVPDHVAAYVINMTASVIVFLGESDKAVSTSKKQP